ncbi:glutathione S-transferase family protein [Gallaecimonas xiamenensis]|uniref:Glutathione S-transferase domain-containing protein n=1 Tax=Gallaecimonas xiamenensis 3-C-1 TaxID=745411 RepID=K2J0Y1_9GAMM|nr:glutathione S-transferase family protein [Gallaecimonas xiamenensis]EKE68482.1 glutathione S-transferase domain-containing protein [Gallaecimonas xiamenensis 3-C-1]
MAIIYGVYFSPFVRKVLLAHAFKGVPFEFKFMAPGSPDPDFSAASPLGKIPAYRTDDGFGFADSSVIIAYLEKTHGANPLYPEAANDYAQALWLEEFCDTKLSEATGGLLFQRFIGPRYFNSPTDPDRVQELCDSLIPKALDYMEGQLGGGWLVNDSLSVADISLGTNLINLDIADYPLDHGRWPKLTAFRARFLALPQVQAQLAQEKAAFNG